MTTILFISSGLQVGGAEMALLKLLRELDRTRFDSHVVSLSGPGEIGRHITALGVPVFDLDFRRHPLRDFTRLVRHARRLRPSVVQTWMYHGDLIGSLAGWLGGARNIVWGLRNSSLSPQSNRRSTIAIRRLLVWLSHVLPQVIVSCSEVARNLHIELGYAANRFRIIGNGFDTDHFRPDPLARQKLRQELRLAPDTPLVINVGRYHPQKNHSGFLRAVGLLRRERPDVQVVMVGKEVDAANVKITGLIKSLGMSGSVHLMGLRQDTEVLMAGSDLLVLSSSFGEAFPQVLGEAMSCGVPCVATDVGDSRLIVGDTGIIVPPLDEAALVEAMGRLLTLPSAQRQQLGAHARQRVIEHYDIRSAARKYEAIYQELTNGTICAV